VADAKESDKKSNNATNFSACAEFSALDILFDSCFLINSLAKTARKIEHRINPEMDLKP